MLAFTAALALAFCGAGSGGIQTRVIAAAEKEEEKIQIKADQLVADLEANQAIFSGNVRVTQGSTVLTADMLQIDYRQNATYRQDPIIEKSAIEKLAARGNVNIQFVDRNAAASAQAMEYVAVTDELTLTGKNSTVVWGDNTLTGSKLIFYRSEGRIRVEGDANEQVRVVFSTQKKLLE